VKNLLGRGKQSDCKSNKPPTKASSKPQSKKKKKNHQQKIKSSIENEDNRRVSARIAFLYFGHTCAAAAPVSLAGPVTSPVGLGSGSGFGSSTATMKLSKLSNQTNSQDPQAVNSRIFVGNLNTFQCSKTDVERMFQIYGRLAGKSLSSSPPNI